MPKETKTNKEKRDVELRTSSLVQSAVLATKGVYSMKRTVRINFDGVSLTSDVYPILDYGVNIPQVAWEIQENVKREIESRLTYPVKAVNIYVQGIHVPD